MILVKPFLTPKCHVVKELGGVQEKIRALLTTASPLGGSGNSFTLYEEPLGNLFFYLFIYSKFSMIILT
jgi:hypothetical protein